MGSALQRPASFLLAATTALLTPYWIVAALGAAIRGAGLFYWCSVLASWLAAATLPSLLLPCWLAWRRDPTVERRTDLRFALFGWAVLVLEALPSVLLKRPTF